VGIGFDSEEGRDRRNEVLVIVPANPFYLGILRINEALKRTEIGVLLSVGMNLLDNRAELL
jgi:hypothetical protein